MHIPYRDSKLTKVTVSVAQFAESDSCCVHTGLTMLSCLAVNFVPYDVPSCILTCMRSCSWTPWEAPRWRL